MAYGSIIEAQDHWSARGYAGVPTDALLQVASAFVDGLGWRMTSAGVPVSRFPGAPTDPEQSEQWPRTGAANVYGVELASDTVPGPVLRATFEAAHYEFTNPGALNAAIRSDERVVREKFGPVEFQYAEDGAGSGLAPTTPIIPTVMTLLAPVLTGGANPYGITGIVA